MRTFYIALTVFILIVAWLLNKPIPKKPQVERAFTAAEIDYLEKTFDYAMETLGEGEYLDWSAAGVNGRISVSKQFDSSRGAQCRKYVEVARTYKAQKVESALACKRSGKDGWCRVYGENPPSCALEVQESMLAKQTRYAILQGEQIIDEATRDAMNIDPSKMLPSLPKMHMPAMPSLGIPEVETPDMPSLRPPMPWDK